MAFKYPTERPAFSVNPNPGALPSSLVERETKEISTDTSEETFKRAQRRVTAGVLDTFWGDMGHICSSAVVQCYAGHPWHADYHQAAERNRSRIEEQRDSEAGQDSEARFAA